MTDLRFAFRVLRKSPAFTGVAVLSLALGIGANTAIFTLINQVILRLLPVKNPQQLVLFNGPGPAFGLNFGSRAFSYPMYRDLRDRNQVFRGVVARYSDSVNLGYQGSTERVNAELVTGNYFEVLGVEPALGRAFTPEDDRAPGAHPLVILDYGYWQRRFGADPTILNKTLDLNGHPMTVIGVAPPGFHGYEVGSPADVFVPMMMKAWMTPTWDRIEDRRALWLNIIARLQPGVSQSQAEAAMNVLYRQILEAEVKDIPGLSAFQRDWFVGKHLELLPGDRGQSRLREDFSQPLIVLMAMVALVLLIACANLANLLLARAAARQKEIAIRLSLGAGRARIVRQLLAEGLLLALCGGALGLLVAAWTGSALLRMLPFAGALRQFSARPDLRVLLFTMAISLLTGVLFSLAPALHSTRLGPAAALKDEAGTASATGGQVALRRALIVAQVALSMILLIGAVLFARSLYNLQTLDPGIRTDHLISFSIDPSLNGYTQPQILALFRDLQEKLATLPGVPAASMSKRPILTGIEARQTIKVEGYRSPERQENMSPTVNSIGPGYFSTLGIPLAAGREFTERDGAGAPKVVIINEKMAHYFFGNENPLGRHVGSPGPNDPVNIEIVGVVKDAKTITVRDDVAHTMYFPYMQENRHDIMTFYVRTVQSPEQMTSALRSVVQGFDARLPITNLKSVRVQVSESLFIERMIALLSAAFGLLATLLAAVGLYGVTAYSVVRRTREIGIRVALGATRGDILRLVMREVILTTALGLAIGLPAALALSRLVRSGLYGLAPHDPLTLTLAAASLAIVAFLAGLLPARRATQVDPMTALRYE